MLSVWAALRMTLITSTFALFMRVKSMFVVTVCKSRVSVSFFSLSLVYKCEVGFNTVTLVWCGFLKCGFLIISCDFLHVSGNISSLLSANGERCGQLHFCCVHATVYKKHFLDISYIYEMSQNWFIQYIYIYGYAGSHSYWSFNFP